MSLEKIAQLNALATQMEEMKKKAIGEITDRKQLRVEAIYKIQDYLRQVCEATKGFGWHADTSVTIYWLVKQNEIGNKYSGVCFSFDGQGGVTISQHASASGIRITDFLNKKEEDFYYKCSDGATRWHDGYLELIDRWAEIKPYIEASAEKSLIERMNKTQKELADFKASYEKVVKFEV
jgi:hypothetical protein